MKQKVSDNAQRFNIAIGFFGEIFKALMASMLISFVPQSCYGESCGVTDRLFTGSDGLYMAASCTNVLTFMSFVYLYYVEISRENKMIGYLEMNRELPRDDEAVEQALVVLGDDKVAELHTLDTKYRTAGHLAMGSFAVNTILSAFPIASNPLDAKTYTVFLTNVIFVISKLLEVREIVNTKPSTFLSAYLTERQQFNDADPDHLIGAVVEDDAAADAAADATDPEEKKEEESVIEMLDPSSNQV